jgi:allantoicase
VWGHPLAPSPSAPLSSELIIPTLPLTPETFKAFGEVVQGFSFGSSAPKGIHVTVANQGTAAKFHRMVNVKNSYQSGALTRGGTYVAVTTAKSRMDIRAGLKLPVQTLER